MKLLLTSGGLTNNAIITSLSNLTQKPFNELNIAFIPTALNLEEGDKWWVIEDLIACKNLGFKSIDIVDISALPKDVWQKRLEEANIILVEGGNTYHLLYWVNKSGLKELLPELLKTRVYIGISAGSMITNPSIILSHSEKTFAKANGITVGDEGLGLVDFLIDPHINSPYSPELTFEYSEKLSKTVSYPVYAIDDQTAIQVVDNKISVISEGQWKKFN